MKIKTELFEYNFIPIGDGTGYLSGGNIYIPKAVHGFFESEPIVGSRPIFIIIEPCVLLDGTEEIYLSGIGGISLGTIKNIETGD